ncbi:hypothetical protein DCCM_0621 [Desulfocucumis palustris]|uniref:Uncharacterized protein n=1 Tax=Desulfocucumis palustris TaxID=1898651 RepID=A0A2L2X889_9FIRM|nr:ferredoxin [Desulfocucumis palustris]GBF32427.1 hypothetical protein DCCM_0621 [Desulfocucumis palustris]
MTAKRDKYLQWKHELLDSCGQCLGFRAKGIDLTATVEKPACAPGVECHKSCPALGRGGSAQKAGEIPAGNITAESPKVYVVQTCHRCGKSEDESVLLPCRVSGESRWVCTKCLPVLIHG